MKQERIHRGGNRRPRFVKDGEAHLYDNTPKWLLYIVARELAALAMGHCDDLKGGSKHLANHIGITKRRMEV